MVLDSTSSLKEVVFLLDPVERLSSAVNELFCSREADILSSNELSSSPDEPPRMNKPPFFLASSSLSCLPDLIGTGEGARWVFDRNDDA